MIPTFAGLQAFDQTAFRQQADDWAAILQRLSQDQADYQKSVLDALDAACWTGEAAAAARARAKACYAEIVATADYAQTVVAALGQAVSGMNWVRAVCSEAQEVIGDNGLSVDGNGNVQLPAGNAPVPWYQPPIDGLMQAQKLIYMARLMAFKIDSYVVPILQLAGERFTGNDSGPWLQDAAGDLAAAQASLQNLWGDLDAIYVPDGPVPADTPAQPYAVESFGLGDVITWDKLTQGAIPYFFVERWTNALALLQNWMGNTGNTGIVDPGAMMSAIPAFNTLIQQALPVAGDMVADTGWTNFEPAAYGIQSDDWYYAFDDFRYRMVAVAMDAPEGQYIAYTVGIRKPYVFNPSHPDLKVHGVDVLTQAQLVHLHTVGRAQNFIAQGVFHTAE